MSAKQIRITKAQHGKLMNQHIGTGFICYKESDDTSVFVEFYTDKNGTVRTMKGYPLDFDAKMKQVFLDECMSDAIDGEIIKVGENQIYYDKNADDSPFVVEVFESNDGYKGTNKPMYSVLDGFSNFADAYKAAQSPQTHKRKMERGSVYLKTDRRIY